MTSILEKEFLDILNNNEIKIVSFDIFDTLFFRKCLLPENIFEIVGENTYVKKYFDTPSGFKKYRMYAEKNARLTNKDLQDITLDLIYKELSIPQKAKEKIKQIELDIEKDFLVVNYDLEKYIDYSIEKGKKVILISDMYLNQNELKYVCLNKLENINKVSKIYVSSEYKLTKAKGNLFLKVLEEENTKPNELFHIGDNKISDNLIPKHLNIHTLYYGFSHLQEITNDYERIYINKDIKKGNHARKLAILRNPYEDEFENFYFNFGASLFGPILFEFSHWLNDLSKKYKIEQYNFILREGFIFDKYFKKLFPNTKTNLVYASRNSTFPIVIDLDNMSSILLGTQRSFTINDLYKSLAIELVNKRIIPYKNELLSKASLINIENITLYEKIIKDLIFRKSEILKRNIEQKKLIKDYFTSLDINKNSIFIDFGSGGTILNRIKRILPKKQTPKINTLFFINERGYEIQSKNRTLSFLPYSQETSKFIETISRSPEVFEILLNLDLGTTLNYSKIENKVIPNTITPNCNQDNIYRIKEAFLNGIDTFFETAKLYKIKKNSYDREFLVKLLARVINLPTKYEVKFFGDLENDEGNNSEHIYKIVDKQRIELINSFGLEKIYFEYQRNKPKYRHTLPWIEAVITTINPDFLVDNYKEPNKNSLNIQVVSQLLEEIDKSDEKEFMVYGAGDLFKELLPFLQDRNINIISLIDSKAYLQEFEVLNYKVITLKEAFESINKANIIIASGVFTQSIRENIIHFAKENSKEIEIFSI
ncbi:hypothetical protein ACNSOO_02935 [Aliarcobacter lanthieri]|uniref:hypothetical protein n=1 Tax=Aliarcobacter lanthieri TaxID=1355374 RepID=UPI003AAB5719